jgi:hypothetical protein
MPSDLRLIGSWLRARANYGCRNGVVVIGGGVLDVVVGCFSIAEGFGGREHVEVDGGAWRGAGRGELSTGVGQRKETHLMSPCSHRCIPRPGTIGLVLIQNTSTSTMALKIRHQRVRHAVAMSADVPYIHSSGLAPRAAHSSDLRSTCFVASARNRRRRRERGRTAGRRSGEASVIIIFGCDVPAKHCRWPKGLENAHAIRVRR